MQINDFITRFFPSKKKVKEGLLQDNQPITLTAVYRKRGMTEQARRAYVTELLDTYYGFGTHYLVDYIEKSISNANIRREMKKIVRCLPLLTFFTNSISRVYLTQPTRKFYLDGKEIIKTPVELSKDNSNQDKIDPNTDKKPFNELLNEDKFIHNDKLFETLNNLYNDEVTIAIKQAERFTNLLHTTVYKVVTDELGKIKIIFLPNDTVQIKATNSDISKAEQLAFIQDTVNLIDNKSVIIPLVENWSKDEKSIPMNKLDKAEIGEEDNINQAAQEYYNLFGTKEAGSAFAPFAIFRDTGSANDFWDQKNDDIVHYIKSINMSLTELKYLEKFTSFGLKYTVNIKAPEDGVIDPNGIIQFAVANSAVPGMDTGKNFEIGEFKNAGSIDEVIKSIIFNMKMLFSLYNIPLDSLISSNSVRSAENKQMDNDELFSAINAQRDIWNNNEQVLFKVMQAVHNRDNQTNKIPKGVELSINFEEQNSVDKTADDWLVEIQNNISTALDWLSAINPDLDRDELMELLKSNKEINDKQKEAPLDLNSFAQMDENGNLTIPKDPNQNNSNQDNQNNNFNNQNNSKNA